MLIDLAKYQIHYPALIRCQENFNLMLNTLTLLQNNNYKTHLELVI